MPDQTDTENALFDAISPHVKSFPKEPMVFYNHDGDCIELILSDESYKATRLDPLLTVYESRETGELVGAVIKGVNAFIHKVLEHVPGFSIEVQDGQIKLEYLFLAKLWTSREPPSGAILRTYQKLRDVAEERGLRVGIELEPA